MIINRTFWTRLKNSVFSAYSYAKDTQASNFAKKYGGDVEYSIDIPNEAERLVDDREVWSFLSNQEPVAGAISGPKEFVIAKCVNSFWSYHGDGYATISEANTEAKKIIPFCSNVLVIKND